MFRCLGCDSNTGDNETTNIQSIGTYANYSQWAVIYPAGVSGVFNLKVTDYDASYDGYLVYKETNDGDNQLTLDATLTDKSYFKLLLAS